MPNPNNELDGGPFLIKLSGEAFGGNGEGVDGESLEFLGRELLSAWREQCKICVVVGGGNFYRGREAMSATIDRIHADHVGMLATVMNGVILQQWVQAQGVPSKVLSSIPVGTICDLYSPELAKEALNAGVLVILVGGIGNPFVTTDTAATLRALEIGAKILIKATRVEGVFDRDPELFDTAIKIDELSFDTALAQQLKVMDAAAFALCRDNELSIRVLDVFDAGNLRRAVCGDEVGTLVIDRSVDHESNNSQ